MNLRPKVRARLPAFFGPCPPRTLQVSSRSALRAKLTASNLPITASFDSDLPSASPTAPLSNVDPEVRRGCGG